MIEQTKLNVDSISLPFWTQTNLEVKLKTPQTLNILI